MNVIGFAIPVLLLAAALELLLETIRKSRGE